MIEPRLVIALGLALALSGCASEGTLVGTAPDGTPIYGKSFTPTVRDGAVTLNCAVGEDRRLTDCRVVSEQPEGKGYGAMALAMTDKPEVRLGGTASTGGRIEFTMRIRD